MVDFLLFVVLKGVVFFVCFRVIEQLKYKLLLIDLFFQDNDFKYISCLIKVWMEQVGIINLVMKILVFFFDLNFIENVWVGMKIFLQYIVKLKIKEEFVFGICFFWRILIVRQCVRYIDYVYCVILQVIMNNGEAINF